MTRNTHVERLLAKELIASNDPSSLALLAARQKGKPMFSIRELSVLAYANGFTLWHYKRGDTLLADSIRTNFFADAKDMMAEGDIVMITGNDAGAVRMIHFNESNQIIAFPMG